MLPQAYKYFSTKNSFVQFYRFPPFPIPSKVSTGLGKTDFRSQLTEIHPVCTTQHHSFTQDKILIRIFLLSKILQDPSS